jgi:uncharacterized protein (DUF2147 family)
MKLISLLLISAVVSVQDHDIKPDAIIGNWRLENGLDIEIYKQNSNYCGKIIALNGFNDDQQLDEYNSDEAHEKDSLIGKVIINHLAYNKEEKTWGNGKMYAPHMGMFANLDIKSVNGDTITAVGSKLFFWHTEQWVKL